MQAYNPVTNIILKSFLQDLSFPVSLTGANLSSKPFGVSILKTCAGEWQRTKIFQFFPRFSVESARPSKRAHHPFSRILMEYGANRRSDFNVCFDSGMLVNMIIETRGISRSPLTYMSMMQQVLQRDLTPRGALGR